MSPKPFGHACATCGGQLITDGISRWCEFACGEPRKELSSDERRRLIREDRQEKAKGVRSQK